MKRAIVLYLLFLSVFVTGCSSDKQSHEDLPYIDIRKDYPEKEIFLSDIADISYLCPNSDDDDYLYRGRIHCITENTIVICDDISGSILFFTKNGNPISRFNHKGQGPVDYLYPLRVFYDETPDDVYVMDMQGRKIQVYSSTGMSKRVIGLPQGIRAMNDIVSYDDSSLFFRDINIELKRYTADYKNLSDSDWISSFYRISKQDGAVLDYLELPMAPVLLEVDHNGTKIPARYKSYIVKNKESILLCNPESDMVFLYRKGQPLLPVIYKTPSVSSTDPMTYLNNCLDFGNYQFMEVYTVRAGDEFVGMFPVKYYMRNKNTGEVVHPTILLPDYKGKEFNIGPSSSRDVTNGLYFELDLIELKQANRENKLSGKLKELVETLNEKEDNNVCMLVNFK